MNNLKSIHANQFKEFTINIHEPFAEYLMADPDEYKFKISLMDVVRFAGHACPAMVGAFLVSRRAVKEIFPETEVCIRGQVAIELSAPVTQGATGPISNVFSMIFGAWERSGFGGLQGKFIRRGLLKYESQAIPLGTFRFHNLTSGKTVDISYDPSRVAIPEEAAGQPFQKLWRHKISAILENPDEYVTCRSVSTK